MKWYGILALVFALFMLLALVYAGANTDKIGFMIIPYAFAESDVMELLLNNRTNHSDSLYG